MANIKLVGNNWEAEGIFDKTQNKTQKAINSEVVSKLNGIEAGAQVNRTYTAKTGKPTANQTPSFGDTATVSQVTQDTTGQISVTDRTIKIPNSTASTSAAGLMSAADKTALNTAVTNIGTMSEMGTAATTLAGGIGELNDNLSAEQAAREAADSALQGSLNSLKYFHRTGCNAVFIGDSWTVGGSASETSKRFSSLVASKLQMQEFNFGVGGAGFIRTGNVFSTQLTTASSQMTSAQKTNTGIVLLCGGVNDLRKMMGTSTASDFANAVVSACNTAHTIFPNALIVVAVSNSESDGFTSDQKYWVTNAIQEVERQITDYPYLIIRNLAASVNGVADNYISDGLHLNDRGHALFAGFIVNAIMGGGQDVFYRIGAVVHVSPAYTYAGGNLWRMNDDIILEASDFVFGATLSANTKFAELPATIIAPNSTAYFPAYKSNQQNGTLAITKTGNLNFIPSAAGTENYTGMLTGNVRWLFTAQS